MNKAYAPTWLPDAATNSSHSLRVDGSALSLSATQLTSRPLLDPLSKTQHPSLDSTSGNSSNFQNDASGSLATSANERDLSNVSRGPRGRLISPIRNALDRSGWKRSW